jgi:hypothetical protein
MSTKAQAILLMILFLFCIIAFANFNINPQHWGFLSRICFGFGSLFIFIKMI